MLASVFLRRRTQAPSLEPEESITREAPAMLMADGLFPGMSGRLYLTDRRLIWSSARVNAPRVSHLELLFSDIEDIGLGRKNWRAPFEHSISLHACGHSFDFYLIGDPNLVGQREPQEFWVSTVRERQHTETSKSDSTCLVVDATVRSLRIYSSFWLALVTILASPLAGFSIYSLIENSDQRPAIAALVVLGWFLLFALAGRTILPLFPIPSLRSAKSE